LAKMAAHHGKNIRFGSTYWILRKCWLLSWQLKRWTIEFVGLRRFAELVRLVPATG
jgi:hypothetical protein